MQGITSDMLLNIYRQGYFPMADSAHDEEFYVVEPKVRGLLPIRELHISKSLKKALRKQNYTIRFNENFTSVIRGCQEATPERADTWINDKIIDLFIELHNQGHAYSVEYWEDNQLKGGLYGLALGTIFCGESMFSRASNASKIALVHLCKILDQTGFEMLDAQFMNDHLKQFGAYEMPQDEYLKHLETKQLKSNNLASYRVNQEEYQT